MLGAFVPTKKRSHSYARASLTEGDLAVKRQRAHHHQHAEMPPPATDLSTAQHFDEPYVNLAACNEAPSGEDLQGLGSSITGELLMPSDAYLESLPFDPNEMPNCSSDTARDEDDEDGEEWSSAPRGGQSDNYWVDPSSLVNCFDDKKVVDMGCLQWSETGSPPNAAEDHTLPASHTATANDPDSSTNDLFNLDIHRSPGPTPHWTELLRNVEQLAVKGHLEASFLPDGSIKLKPSDWPTPEPDSFLTKASLGFGPDTGLTEKEFSDGPLCMYADSVSSHVSAEDTLTPTILFPGDCASPDPDITCSEDFDLCCTSPATICPSPPTNCPPSSIVCPPPGTNCASPATVCPPPGTIYSPPATSFQSGITELLDLLLMKVKTASEKVTDPEFLAICKELDQLILDYGTYDHGTYEIRGRAVTVASSTEFAKTKPFELSAVADVLAKQPPHGETNLNFVYVVPNRNPKDLNKYLPEKTWTNGGKNKEKPTTLNEAMVVQHIGFGASKLAPEEIPGYLRLDAEDRAMLRFSMRVYTRRGVKSSKKAYPTAYIILTLKKPIRRLRHARRAQQ